MCALDLNPGPQDGWRRQNHGAMAATHVQYSYVEALGFNQRTLGQLSNGRIFPHIIFQKTHKMIVEDPKTDESLMLQQYTTPHALFVACEVLDCLQSWKVILKESWDHGGGQMVHA